jgi:hypothetical protein
MYDADHPYNPLDLESIAHSVETTLLQQEPMTMPLSARFAGSGIYLIYYKGDFPDYAPISSTDFEVPIYVGKAIPKGGRQGKASGAQTDPQLYGRLREHSNSIAAAENLAIEDFVCRALVVEDLFIGLGEQIAIRHFRPVWNQAVGGFGNHGTGSGRYEGKRSDWDILHPGRSWADRLQPGRDLPDIRAEIKLHFEDVAGEIPPSGSSTTLVPPPPGDEG